MDGIRQYLLSVTAAAIFCGIVKGFADEKSVAGAMIRLGTGLLMAVTVLSPFVKLQLGDLPVLSGTFWNEAESAAQDGEAMAEDCATGIIKAQVEAYILDKAASYETELTVDVIISEGDSLLPEKVILSGAVSPYAKVRLQQIISQDLGIAKENQVWTG